MGWVHGGGTPVGMLAEMLAASLNANLGGRDHIPIEVERQIVRWMRAIFGFPESATGLFVTGSFDGESHRRADRPRCGVGVRGALRGCRRESSHDSPPMPRRPFTTASREPWISPASAAMRSV